jgi:hypothetical protein
MSTRVESPTVGRGSAPTANLMSTRVESPTVGRVAVRAAAGGVASRRVEISEAPPTAK